MDICVITHPPSACDAPHTKVVHKKLVKLEVMCVEIRWKHTNMNE